MSRIALLIANATYANLPELECCGEDLAAIEGMLHATGRYDLVRTLQDGSADAIKSAIREALVGDLDEVFFYFSGHGVQINREFYFCAADFQKSDSEATGLSNGELHAMLRANNPETVIKVIDACSSGALLIKSDGGFLPTHKEGLKNLIQISSCLDVQSSITGQPLSEFTKSFCQACLRKEQGPVFYTDIISALRDDYLDNNNQTPHFTSQGTGREVFVEDASVLAAFRRVFETRWLSASAAGGTGPERTQGAAPSAPVEKPPAGPAGGPKALVPFWQRLFEVGEIGIDLGTANTRIVLPRLGIVLDEPSLLAFEPMSGWKRVKAVGRELESMQSAREESVTTIRPLREGFIDEFDAAVQMVKHFLGQVRAAHVLPRRLDVIVSTPAGATPVERRALDDVVALATDARSVRLVEAPMAAAIGADMPVTTQISSMVVDIGAGKTDIGILSSRGLAYRRRLQTGGHAMDQAILDAIRTGHGLQIDLEMAERIKNQVGSARRPENGEQLHVYVKGHHLAYSSPMEIAISLKQVADALAETVGTILEAIRVALANSPARHSAHIIDQGIGLTGGAALLKDLAEVVHDETGLPVYVADDALTCVAKGIGEILDNPALRTVLITA